nr:hypothetical protein Iba_chr11aCG13760 [Ipomoea batatas]
MEDGDELDEVAVRRATYVVDTAAALNDERQSKSSRGLHLRRAPYGNGSGGFMRSIDNPSLSIDFKLPRYLSILPCGVKSSFLPVDLPLHFSLTSRQWRLGWGSSAAAGRTVPMEDGDELDEVAVRRATYVVDTAAALNDERQSKSSRGLHLRRAPYSNGSGGFMRCGLFRGSLPCGSPCFQ